MNNIKTGIFVTLLLIASIGTLYLTAPIKDAQKSVSVNSNDADERFKIAMKTVMRHEGGLSNHKNDKGSLTKYGISLRYLKQANIDIDGDGDSDSDDIIHLTRTDADKIYYRDFWKNNRYDEIIDVVIATDIFDFSINAGSSAANKLVKRALNDITNDNIPITGSMNNETIKIINSIDRTLLHTAINNQQESFYRELVQRNPSFSVFLKGWIARSKD